ncbi:MAG: RidA family protein [Rhizobiaceae bacterium]
MLTHVPHEKHNRYSEAITVPLGGATMAFVAGQWGVAPGSTEKPSVEAETRACFANVQKVLAKCGMGFADVVRIDVFLSDLALYDEFSRVRSEIFPDKPPTSTLVRADMLLGARVEITAIAVKASA